MNVYWLKKLRKKAEEIYIVVSATDIEGSGFYVMCGKRGNYIPVYFYADCIKALTLCDIRRKEFIIESVNNLRERKQKFKRIY